MEKTKLKLSTSKIIGIYIFLIGSIILLKILFYDNLDIIFIILLLLLIPSVDLTIRGIYKKRHRKFIIIGIIILLSVIFLLIYQLFIDKRVISMKQLWPIFGYFPPISMILYYFKSNKYKYPAILVPTFFLIILSTILLLFTCGIINFQFKYFILLSIPLLIILLGLYLIFSNEIRLLKKNIDKNIQINKKNKYEKIKTNNK